MVQEDEREREEIHCTKVLSIERPLESSEYAYKYTNNTESAFNMGLLFSSSKKYLIID